MGNDSAKLLGSGVFLGRCQLPGAMPGQELVNTVDRMIGDVSQHMAQPGFGVDTVQLGRPDQRVDGGSAFAAGVGAGKQVVTATNGQPTQSAFCCGVVDLDLAVIAVARQRRP